jgi:two-component sensor histidine kinase
MIGEHPLHLLGPLLHDLATGRTLVVNEGAKDPRTRAIHGRSVMGDGVQGVVMVPTHKEGRWVSCLGLFTAKPHAWTRREASLAHATMERTWLCVERLQHIAVLRDFNRDLEQRVEGRTRELKAALREKEVLLKEIHHRVKNNLQVISSMLNLQAMHMPDGIGRSMFAESQGRVQSIALVHEALYRSKDLSSVNFVEYLHSLVNSVFHAQSGPGRHIEAKVEADDIRLAVAVAIPCGLIVNELVTNALKHAFPNGRAGTIKVELRRADGEQVELCVRDDGIGMTGGPKPAGVNGSLGLDLIYTFAEQLEAKIQVSTEQGTEFRLTFRDRAE